MMTDTIEPVTKLDDDERRRFAQQLVDRSRTEGVDLIGSGEQGSPRNPLFQASAVCFPWTDIPQPRGSL